jgi:endo-1,3-1,4-beta-glycanase ExoK
MKKVRRLLLITGFFCVLMAVQGCRSNLKTPQNPQFTLEWEDHLDSYDTSRWETGSHTFRNNVAQFDPENVSFQDGTMRLHLNKKKMPERDFAGAEYRTKESFLYGRFVARAKFTSGSGIVTSFFTFRDPAIPHWQEIDVEILGIDTSHVQFTYWWDRTPNYEKELMGLDFTTDGDFHEYAFEWIPGQITWYIDGQKMFTVTDEKVPYMPQKIMMNIWINDSPNWAGAFDPSALPAYAEYDYIKYYRLDPTE